jgi:ABC-type phosphate/phosphonate transport system substrate-binding protein
MSGTRCLVVAILAVACSLPALVLDRSAGAEEITRTPPIRVGVAGSVFRDTPAPLVNMMMKPLKSLLETQTGVNGDMVAGTDALSLGNQLADDKVQLAVFHGFEFAWVKQKHPDLKPLIVCVCPAPCYKANVIVLKDSKAKDVAALKGLKVALPPHTREHCHLFLERQCGEAPCKFFSDVSHPENIEEALDNVVDGLVDATVVDGTCLDNYAERKPGRFAKLKTLIQSEAFPFSVVACNPANFNEDAQKRFRDGLINAAQSRKGQQLLTICRITGFEKVPDDFEKELKDIAKSYPPPEPHK